MILDDKAKRRFWAKVDKTGDCWLWTAYCDAQTYGHFSLGRSMPRAHRISWIINIGPIPEGMFVLHSCDTPSCVRPNHLWLGSHQDNMDDMKNKGRARTKDQKGESNGHAKLTESAVIEIRRKYNDGGISMRKLACEFEVSIGLICLIINRKIWSHI